MKQSKCRVERIVTLLVGQDGQGMAIGLRGMATSCLRQFPPP